MGGIGEWQSRLEISRPEQALHTYRGIEHVVRPVGHKRKVAVCINPLEVRRKILFSDGDLDTKSFKRLFYLKSRVLVLLASGNEVVEKVKPISIAIAPETRCVEQPLRFRRIEGGRR